MLQASDQDAFHWGNSGHVEIGRDPWMEPEYAGGIMCPTWPGLPRDPSVNAGQRGCSERTSAACHHDSDLDMQQKADVWLYLHQGVSVFLLSLARW